MLILRRRFCACRRHAACLFIRRYAVVSDSASGREMADRQLRRYSATRRCCLIRRRFYAARERDDLTRATLPAAATVPRRAYYAIRHHIAAQRR